MKVLYYDCFCGISGDMNLGAMLDLGVDEAYLRAALSQLPMADEFELKVYRESRKGIEGTKVDVVLKHEHHGHEHHGHEHHGHHHEHHEHHHEHHGHEHHGHGHHHGHEHHGHGHHHGHEHHGHHHGHQEHHHEHRNLAHVKGIIEASGLSDRVKALSLEIFMAVAEAEAKVHGKPIEEVHFHEVGAVDSIVDIVGAAICFEALGVEVVMASPVQLGGGFVKCDHGMMPVPAPATAEILKGVPMKSGLVAKELTTPTGAAIIKVLVDEFTEAISGEILKVGYGVGTRDFEYPNVLRAMLVEVAGDIQKKKK